MKPTLKKVDSDEKNSNIEKKRVSAQNNAIPVPDNYSYQSKSTDRRVSFSESQNSVQLSSTAIGSITPPDSMSRSNYSESISTTVIPPRMGLFQRKQTYEETETNSSTRSSSSRSKFSMSTMTSKSSSKKLSPKQDSDNMESEQCGIIRIMNIHLGFYEQDKLQAQQVSTLTRGRYKIQEIGSNAATKITNNVFARRSSTAASPLTTFAEARRKSSVFVKQVTFGEDVEVFEEEEGNVKKFSKFKRQRQSVKESDSDTTIVESEYEVPKSPPKPLEDQIHELDGIVASEDPFHISYRMHRAEHSEELFDDSIDISDRLIELLEKKRKAEDYSKSRRIRCPCSCL